LDILADRGVQGKVKLPGVGENLQDHLQIRSVYQLKPGTVTVNHWTKAGSWPGRLMLGAEYILKQSGPLSMAPSQFGLFAHSGIDNYHGTTNNTSSQKEEECHDDDGVTPNTPDLQFHVQPLSLDDLSDPDSLHKFPGLTTSVCNLRPTSRGSVHLTAPSSSSAPDIDPQYLSTERDCLVAASALRLARNLVLDSPSFAKKYETSEYKPGLEISTDKDLAEAAGNISSSIFHPIGTCRLGKTSTSSNTSFVELDEYGVVDYQLKVRGVKGVRVCDGSIMPTITSGNTNSPILAIAEKAAHMILK
jgi:choline dehydrogenase